MDALKFNLQWFATNKTTDSGLSDEMKTYYEKRLIDLAEPKLVHNQFGDKYPIPRNGGKTIEFRKFAPLAKAMTPISEGVTPTGNQLNVSAITAEISQYGDYIETSDILDLTAIDNVIVQSTKILGSQAGRTLDSVTRDVLAGGTNVIYAGGRASRESLTTADTLVPDLFNQAATVLAAQNADEIDDSYVAIIHPYAKYDLISSSAWIDVHKYADPTAIYDGEIGKLGNIRFVESTEAKIWKDDTCPAISYAKTTDVAVVPGKTYYTKSGDVYTKVTTPVTADIGDYYEKTPYAVFSTLVLGAHAYGVTELEGGGLEHIVKALGSGGTTDPLNQRATVGWKATAVAERLVEQYMVRIESLSAYSATASAN